jgi:hypothetical protein
MRHNQHLKNYLREIIRPEGQKTKTSLKDMERTTGIDAPTLSRLANQTMYYTPGLHLVAKLRALGLDPMKAFELADKDNQESGTHEQRHSSGQAGT